MRTEDRMLLGDTAAGYLLAHRVRGTDLLDLPHEAGSELEVAQVVAARTQAYRLAAARHGGPHADAVAEQMLELLGRPGERAGRLLAMERDVARLLGGPLHGASWRGAPRHGGPQHGVGAEPAGPTRYEQVLLDHAPDTLGLTALMAAAGRSTRASQVARAGGEPALDRARADVVTGVAGPMVAGYVLWCLEQARLVGARRLYFLSRDGEVLLRVARPLVEALGLDLDLRYLEGSRRAWMLRSLTGPSGRDVLASLLGREESVTLRGCTGWLGLDPADLADELAAAGLPASEPDAPLDRSRLGSVLDVLVEPSVLRRAQERCGDADEATRVYLEQVGLLDGTPYALVDADGRGSVGRLLAPLVTDDGGVLPAVECYLTLNGPVEPAPGRTLRGYLRDEWRDLGHARTTDLWVAVEVFTAAGHGRVEGYRLVDGGAEAVHGELDPRLREWGLDEVRALTDRWASCLATLLEAAGPRVARPDCRAAVEDVLQLFWVDPTPDEVAGWGSFPFESDVDTYPVAEPFSVGDVVRSVREGRPRFRRRGSWPAGTFHNSPAALKLVRRAAGLLRRLVRRPG